MQNNAPLELLHTVIHIDWLCRYALKQYDELIGHVLPVTKPLLRKHMDDLEARRTPPPARPPTRGPPALWPPALERPSRHPRRAFCYE